MLKKTSLYSLFIISSYLTSCSVEPKPINYGKDACYFCKMNIVDQQHGTEIVTKKGKVFKYDSIECMLKDYKNLDVNKVALFLVNTYDQPSNLIDAKQVTYMKCEAIPSPMGAFLTAFSSKDEALLIKKIKGGELFSWQELNHSYSTK